MINWVSKSFSRQIVVLLLAVISIPATMITYLEYEKEASRLDQILLKQSLDLIESVALLVADDVRYNKHFELWNQLNALKDNLIDDNVNGNLFAIEELTIVDNKNLVIATTNPRQFPVMLSYENILFENIEQQDLIDGHLNYRVFEERAFIVFSDVIYFGNEELGRFQVTSDIKALQQLKKDLITDFSYIVLTVIVTILVLAIIIARIISSPVQNVLNAISHMGNGDIKLTSLKRRSDELSKLATAIESADQHIFKDRRLRQVHQKNLEIILETIPTPIYIKDTDLNFVSCNYAFAELVSIEKREEISGKNTNDIFLNKEIASLVEQKNKKLLAEGDEQQWDLHLELNGEAHEYEVHESIFHTHDGKIAGILGVMADVTILKSAKTAAENANKAKSEFLTNMSHELRTPMHAVLAYADLGMKKSSNAEVDKILSYFDKINVSGHRLLTLLNDLLDLSKLEAGKMQFDFTRQAMKSIIDSCIDEISAHSAKQHLKLETRINSQQAAEFDQNKIGQVITNFLSNAIKFSPEMQTIHVSVDDEEMITPNNTESSAAIKVSVKDEGVGIPEAELDMVFDKFVQSSKTKSGAGGTGLGLAISKEIIESHHGKIWAEKNAGAGTTFSFIIPLRQQDV